MVTLCEIQIIFPVVQIQNLVFRGGVNGIAQCGHIQAFGITSSENNKKKQNIVLSCSVALYHRHHRLVPSPIQVFQRYINLVI